MISALQGDTIWQRFKRGKRDQHWYYASIVKALSPRKKEFRVIGELEEIVKESFWLFRNLIYGKRDN